MTDYKLAFTVLWKKMANVFSNLFCWKLGMKTDTMFRFCVQILPAQLLFMLVILWMINKTVRQIFVLNSCTKSNCLWFYHWLLTFYNTGSYRSSSFCHFTCLYPYLHIETENFIKRDQTKGKLKELPDFKISTEIWNKNIGVCVFSGLLVDSETLMKRVKVTY